MEEEVRNDPKLHIKQRGELQLLVWDRNRNLLLLLALESVLLALSGAQNLERALGALLQLRHGGEVVVHLDPVEAGYAALHGFGDVGEEGDLEGERAHVVGDLRLDERVGGDVVLFGP